MFRSSRKGFTLIELMIVIAIIAILAAILVPNFIRARAQGQLTSCKSNLKNMATALEMYSTDHNGQYPISGSWSASNSINRQSASGGILGAYLKQMPTCAGSGTSSYEYTSTHNPDTYTLWCKGTNHVAAGLTDSNYPEYDAFIGLIEQNKF
ncbi:prepilin-type N-terminal cleavage/methylation domain-containing protein [bacterium]|nr:prepilin-type N-terminal cleavage/methylation domain-containing protein [bacterium]